MPVYLERTRSHNEGRVSTPACYLLLAPRVCTLVLSSWFCVSVTQHLTSAMFVRLTNDTTYLTGNEGQNFRTVFSEKAPLQS